MAKYLFKLRRGKKITDEHGNITRNDWAEYKTRDNYMPPQGGEMVLEYDNGIPRIKIGDGINDFDALPYMSVDSFILPKQATIELTTQWSVASDNRHFQIVSVNGADVTPNSKIDLQPTPEQLSIFHEKELTFVAENEGGEVRVYCVGQAPQNPYTIPATVTEIVCGNTIIGNTTATPSPRPDWTQDDELKADFIKNKPDIYDKNQIDAMFGDYVVEVDALVGGGF